MSDRDLKGLNAVFGEFDRRVTALEAKTKPAQQAGDVQALRAMAVRLNRKLTAKQRDERKAANTTYWLKLFAAHALPTAMLQVNTNAHAAALAADAAFDLLAELERRMKSLPKVDDEREESEKT